jgi:hypothetical protein
MQHEPLKKQHVPLIRHNSVPQLDLLFPPGLIPAIVEARGKFWREKIIMDLAGKSSLISETALILTMARLVNCAACHANSYRASQGCAYCSNQALRRYQGTDDDLLELYKTTIIEVQEFLSTKHPESKFNNNS